MNEFFRKPLVKILMLKGEKGEKGENGENGAGTPKGGKTGQYLQKKTDADYDYIWADITTVAWDDVTGKPDAYPTTWDNVTGKPSTYPTTWDNVTGKPSTYPTTWDNVTGKPSTFAPTPSVTKSFTLSADGWVYKEEFKQYLYEIADSLVTATSNQEVIPNPIINMEQLNALQEANLVGSQDTGKLKLWAYGTKPTIDIPIQVIFRGNI